MAPLLDERGHRLHEGEAEVRELQADRAAGRFTDDRGGLPHHVLGVDYGRTAEFLLIVQGREQGAAKAAYPSKRPLATWKTRITYT